MGDKLRQKIRLIMKSAILGVLLSAVSLSSTGCKQSGDAFSFAGEVDQNEQQGSPRILSVFPDSSLVVQCVSPLSNPRCGSASSLSTSSTQTYSVSVDGAAPISYVWRLNGNVVTGADSAIYNLVTNPSGITAGVYTLQVTATNSQGSTSHTFNVKVNQPPLIVNPSPSNAAAFGINVAEQHSFTVDATDGNSDTISYAWSLDGISSARLTGAAITTGSQGDYNPTLSDLGARVIKVVATDAHAGEIGAGRYEPASATWNVRVNYFSQACNNLVAGSICTAVGQPGLVKDTLPSGALDGNFAATTEQIKIRPNYIFNDGSNNLFISDSANHMVWFHNRSGSSVVRLGVTIAAGSVAGIVGSGGAGISNDNDSSFKHLNYKLSAPQMVHYDVSDDVLYIADYGNNRVVRVNSDGTGMTVFGNITTTANNTTTNGNSATEIPATTSVCVRPVGLVMNAAETRMYVACSGSHFIKYINTTDPNPANWTSSVSVGRLSNTGGVTAGDDSGFVAGGGWNNLTARINTPWALALDANQNLYFTTNNSTGRLKVLRIAANPTSYFQGNVPTPTVGHIYNLAGADGDNNNSSVNVTRANWRLRDGRGIAILEPSAGNITGFFVSNGLRSLVSFLNNSSATQSMGGINIPSATDPANLSAGPVWGVYSNLGGAYTGEGAPASNANRLNNPTGVLLMTESSTSYLVVGDTLNFRVRRLNISTANGSTSVVTGGVISKHGSSSDSVVPAPNFSGYFLEQMIYDTSRDKIYFGDNGASPTAWNTAELPRSSDFDNHRIRRLDPITGAVDTLVGRGWGDTSPLNEPANTALIQGVRGIAVLPDGNFLYADRHLFSNGGARSCMVRVYNALTVDRSYFGSNILAGNVGTVAGNYAQGCNGYLGNGGSALSARIYYPEGVATDGTNLYISSFQQHCILKVDNSGTITQFIGTCGTAGDSTGAIGASRFLRFPTQLLTDPRHSTNFFVVDQTDQATTSIKYVNLSGASVTIVGSEIQDDRIETLTPLTAAGYTQAMAVWKDPTNANNDLICYTSGALGNGSLGSHNVICRTRLTGDLSIRIGQSDGSPVKGGTQYQQNEEGAVWNSTTKVLSVRLHGPAGLTFDSEGNLYITERDAHVIRKVKRWF